MSNICLKVTIETQNFNFLGIKIFYQFRFGELQLSQISLNFKTCCNLKIKRLGAKLCGFSIILILKGVMTFQSQRVHALC